MKARTETMILVTAENEYALYDGWWAAFAMGGAGVRKRPVCRRFHDRTVWAGASHPLRQDVVARIVRGETGARNAHLRRLILRHLDWHDDLLVVFGASHLLALYPALKARLPKLVTG